MKKWIVIVLLSLGAGYWLGRQSIPELVEAFSSVTPREAYVQRLAASGLTATALGRLWARAGDAALRDAPPVTPPFREAGYLDPARPQAVAYRFRARAGQRVAVRVRVEPPSNALLFIDLFRVPEDPAREPVHVVSADSGEASIDHEPRRDADYIIRIQPELLRGGRYTLTAETAPTLAFPVAGMGVAQIQSFWGAPRDGGARQHHGVDIFAPRGTPVVAAADGFVSSIRSTAIGGNVVWLRDERAGQSLYYAHLDRQLVERGDRVQRGDTIGLVGNSGNARGTPPHLHFGIYARGVGPMDPLPFVEPPPGRPRDPSVPLAAIGGWRRTAVGGARLRAAPGAAAPVVSELEDDAPLHVLAATDGWYRVRTPDGQVGFVGGDLTEPLAPLRTAALADTVSLRDRPDEAGVEIARLAPGEAVEVLGSAGDHLYVRARGRLAWVARGAAL
ncbi:MAG TPA: peptidoglycan DD-metalloendopeptidase family protein [Longimicrobiales bacterium]|nr:peptidoglycan DD-metalloendopeptidase family protein [Longimicrobiales bacterium]